jgi:hypothetical protein
MFDFARQVLRTLFTPQELKTCILPPARKHLSRPPLDEERFNVFHGTFLKLHLAPTCFYSISNKRRAITPDNFFVNMTRITLTIIMNKL